MSRSNAPWRLRVAHRRPPAPRPAYHDEVADPVDTDPDKYRVVMENERVRVLEYHDRPGDRTTPHGHSDSIMVTLSGFERRLHQGERSMDVSLEAGETRWLPAQEHAGENIGTTETHVLFVELKGPVARTARDDALGPEGSRPAS